MTTTENQFKTSDIRLRKDSQGYYYAEHKNQGQLYDFCYFFNRKDARRAAVEELQYIKENGNEDTDWMDGYND
tara:strand:+ start:268 stop:486 length:219 start_codon:yes stop_codon:yes gene_type:complete